MGLDLLDDDGVRVSPLLTVGLNIFKLPVGLGFGLTLKFKGSGLVENLTSFGVSLRNAAIKVIY